MLNNFFTSESVAQTTDATPATPGDFSFSSFVPLILIFVIFYFLIVRPQSKKMKDHQQMVNNLKVGDKVVTNGGIIGVVTRVLESENQVEVEISENVNVKFLKQYVADLVTNEKAKK